jgi:hypothetical protein
MKLLEILLESPGEVVTREELRSRVWANESFGDFDQAVNIAIAKLRTALGTRLRIRDISRLFRNVAIAALRTCRLPMQTPAQKGRSLRPENSLGQSLSIRSKAAGCPLRPNASLWPARRVIFALALVLSLPILSIWLFRSHGRAPTGIRSLAVLPRPCRILG